MSKVLVDREVLEKSLDALWQTATQKGEEAIAALRTALEQPAVGPVAIVVDPYDTPGVHTNGKPLAMLGIDQLRDENKELRQEVERLRLPYDWYPHSKDLRDSPQERGEWLHTMYQQSKRREAELDAEVESLRNDAAAYHALRAELDKQMGCEKCQQNQ